jgi:gliding motility-associated protein GldE
MDMLVQMVLVLTLLLGSALISGAEVAFFSLSPATIKDASEDSDRAKRLMAKLQSNPKRLLTTILVANNLINISIVLLFSSMNFAILESISYQWLQVLIKVAVISAFILTFGEIIPKIYANRNAESFFLMMTLPLYIADRYLLFMFSYPLSKLTFFFQNKLNKTSSDISVDQLSQALEMTDDSETTHEEQKLLQGIVSFGAMDTKQVMRPRIDVFAVHEQTPFSEVLTQVVEMGYSRVPVYEEHIDQITGVLYVKDLLPHILKNDFDWLPLVRPPYFVPENKKLDDLLKEFQTKRIHLAVVVDEYGGTSGIVSLEDIIEEIVGEISDEFDDDDLMYSKIDDVNYVIDGKTYLKDFYRILDIDQTEIFDNIKGESETLAGFVLEYLGYFPRVGTKFKFHQFKFVIEAVDRKRIKQIKVTKKES